MQPEVWVPAVATLVAPFIPLLIAGLQNHRSINRSQAFAAAPSKASPTLRAASLTAIPAAVVAAMVPSPLSWVIGGVYIIVFSIILTWIALRRRRGPRVDPEAERLLNSGSRSSPGYEYDRDFLPDLVRVYTRNDLTRDRGVRDGNVQGQDERKQPQEAVPEQRVTFEKILADPKVRHIAITGEAGIGKTFLLRYWHHDLNHRVPSAVDPIAKYRPLLIAARKLVGCDSIAEAFGKDSADALARPPGKGLTWLVMIDAFDEITDAADRREVELLVFDAIDDAVRTGWACKFVITTRGLTDDRRRSFESRGIAEYELQIFTPEQLRAFLIKAETSIPDHEAESGEYAAAVMKVDRLLKRWEAHDDLLELIRLPLLARVAATIYFQDLQLELPARRIDIYQDAIEHWIGQFHKRMMAERAAHGPALELLHQWYQGIVGEATTIEFGPETTDAAVRKLLCALAFQYLKTGQRSVVGIACDLLDLQVRPKDPGQLEALLTLLEATGLVHDVRTIGASFVHKSYAEFLAAPAMCSDFASPADWNRAFRDPERRIGAVFAFGQLPNGERQSLIATLREGDAYVHALGWIAAEGLCVTSESGRIDEEVRGSLVELVIESWPPYPKSDWWQLVGALCGIARARDLLLRLVDERRLSDSGSTLTAASLAKHDPRGVERLCGFASVGFAAAVRSLAAGELFDHDQQRAKEIWVRMVEGSDVPDNERVEAVARLAEHWPEEWVPRLRSLVEDLAVFPLARVTAAARLGMHDKAGAADYLRSFVDKRAFTVYARVSAARHLCDYELETGTNALLSFTSDLGISEWPRIRAAYDLASYDRETGVALLWSFVDDRTLDEGTRIGALGDLREYDLDEALRRLRVKSEDVGLDADDRIHAARYLVYEGVPLGREVLESIADSPTQSDFSRVSAASDLVEFDRPKWIARLCEHAADPWIDDHARVTAGYHLVEQDYAIGIQWLLHFAQDSTLRDGARAVAQMYLRDMGFSRANVLLRTFAEHERHEGIQRVWTASRLAENQLDLGISLLRKLAGDVSQSTEVRVSALEGLNDVGNDEAPALLLAIAADERVEGSARVSAAMSLGSSVPKECAATLRKLADTQDLCDRDRVVAAQRLVTLDLDAGMPILHDLASRSSWDDRCRVIASKAVLDLDPDEGLPLLESLAMNSTAYHSTSVQAAYQLSRIGWEQGPFLLAQQAVDPELLDSANVQAAVYLLDFDLARGTALIETQARDFSLEDSAQVSAACTLMRIDREAGVPALRAITNADLYPGGRAALAAQWLARINADEGAPLLRNLAVCEQMQGLNRVYGAIGLMRFERGRGLDLLRSFAAGSGVDEFTQAHAAAKLLEFDHAAGIRALERLVEDASVPSIVRVDAADTLTYYDLPRWLEQLRRFVHDETIDELSRVTAAMSVSYERKHEGLELLKALFADESISATARCLAEVDLAFGDLKARTALERPRPGDSVDYGRLRSEADNMTRLCWSTAYQIRRRIGLVEAAASAS